MSIDYYTKIAEMSDDDLTAELKRLNDALFKMNHNSPMFSQLQDMLQLATDQRQERFFMARNKNLKDETLDIGEMESVDYTPDYSKQELLNVTVEAYTKGIDK